VLKTNGVFDDSATLYPSQIIVVATFATLIINAFLRTAGALASLPKSIVSARRVNEVLNYVDPIQDVKQLSKPFTTTGEITFKNVSFTYPNSAIPTLKGISFNVSKGQTLGIIGANGAGKSTIIELMQRFYDCTKGSIAIDGIDVRQIPLKILRNKIGYVSQKVFLFRNTLKNNIYFKETKINETLMKDIADVSHLNDFITTLPHQYDAQISENGVNLSGGQKQRVSIARALAKNPEFLIFDNSFSALDYRTSKSVLKKILIKYKNTTKIITSHRVADIANADLILLIDQGKIVAHGSHRELYQKNKTYQQIVKSQITDQEALLI
jgi:ATP-binding cassette subfamily B protein